jgi:hypothetical protein
MRGSLPTSRRIRKLKKTSTIHLRLRVPEQFPPANRPRVAELSAIYTREAISREKTASLRVIGPG